MNQFIIVGKMSLLSNIINPFNNMYELELTVPNPDNSKENESYSNIVLWIKPDMYKNLKTYVQINNILGIKGYILNKNDSNYLIANKITFLKNC